MKAAAVALASLLALAAHAGCPLSSFGAEKVKACARKACRALKPSPEIDAIERGAYLEYVSLDFSGTDIRTWLAFDADRGEVVYIQRYPARSYEKLLRTRGLANALWKVDAEGDEQVRYATDVYTGFFLLDGKQARQLGGLGIPKGQAKKLEDLLESLKDPDWEWWNVF